MISRPRLIFVVFYVTGILIATVCLRTISCKTFNQCRSAIIEQKRLKQQLWQRQLRFESLINPPAVSERLGQAGGDKSGEPVKN